MYSTKALENMLILDIETVSGYPDFEQMPERMQQLWGKKAGLIMKREDSEVTVEDLYPLRAAIFAEFGKVVCISCGMMRFSGKQARIHMKSYYGSDEQKVLADFALMLDQFSKGSGGQVNPEKTLCAHNGKEFDFPYLGRRYLIQGLPLPPFIRDLHGKKPWEIKLVDTMQLWKFGDFKSFTSLDLLTGALDIPSPKDDIDGSEVGRVFWEEEDAERIARYCEKDVVATAQVLLRFSGLPLLEAVHSEMNNVQ